MDQDTISPDPGKPAKEFLALSHGQEWLHFYESFDQLVKENLSRSSDLLRRAMTLPEVADREVAALRAEMDSRLAAERAHGRDALARLREEIVASQRQAALLARGISTVIAEIERLTQRVDAEIAHYDAPAAAAPLTDPAESAEEAAGPATVVTEVAAEATDDPAAESGVALPDEPILIGAPEPAGPAGDREGELVAAGGGSASGERPRPHWLSVTRVGSRT